jgi:GT2 family glycosyltransferase
MSSQGTASVKLSVIIVNYNDWDTTASCIETLRDRIDLQASNFEIVVVDNSSISPETERFRRALGMKSTLVRNQRNEGFGHACNIGVRASMGSTLWFLNNDTQLGEGSVDVMVRLLDKEPHLGGISASLFYPSGAEQTVGQMFPGLLAPLSNRLSIGEAMRSRPEMMHAGRLLSALPFAPRSVKAYFRNLAPKRGSTSLSIYDWVTAASLFMRRDVFESVGGFDERIFLYFEDLDLCWRLSRRGYRFAVLPSLRVIHAVGASTKRNPRMARIRRRSEAYVYRRILSKGAYRLYSALIRPW